MERARAHLLQNYKQQPVVVERGEGTRVWDADGRQYLDLLGGIATLPFGHCHPAITAAVKAQLDRLWHVSNVFYSEPQIALAEKLVETSGLERVFFCNSGAEANEALIKLARKVQKDRRQPDRVEIVCFERSFHGRTLATVTATGQPKYQKGFEPLPPGFLHVPYGEMEAVRRAVGPRTAAVLVEAIQGEGGVRPAPEGFLAALRALCDEVGALLLVDEVQTGIGRTGRMFAFQHAGIRPDGFSLAKSLGNGLPIGAMVCTEEAGQSLQPGTHGSTFGGNPVTAAAGLATVTLASDPAVLASNRAQGEYFLAGLRSLRAERPTEVVEARGQGLLLGVELAADAGPVVGRMRELGVLCNLAGERTLRFAPSYLVTREEIDQGLQALRRALGSTPAI
ncbi:MAG TPA: aspartate aminotransferase family protein [Myxococcaceae bacterium]|nr:aspartate aminotransferase family protein [Myxococcaceae bacterium]